jgi:hypothetical protein
MPVPVLDPHDEGAAALVPLRAASDDRLTAHHWRLLAGLGAYPVAGQEVEICFAQLGRCVGLHPLAAYDALIELARWGYVANGPLGGKSYRILYEAPEAPGGAA